MILQFSAVSAPGDVPGKISKAFLHAFSYPSITSGGERPCKAKTFILLTKFSQHPNL